MNLLFHELFSNTAAAMPDHTALCDSNGSMTYREADEASNSLAAALQNDGLATGEAVAVLVSRQKELLVGAIAVMKAGGVFLPLDEAYPDERLAYMMEDAGVRFVLADRHLAENRCSALEKCRLFFLNETTPLPDFTPVPRGSDDPVMILYTSGTTGKPKGVIHRHALLQGVNDWLDGHTDLAFTTKSRMGIMSGFTFVATNVFMFGTLSAGGTVCIAPNDVRQNTDILYRYIKENGITHMFMPSSLTATMAEEYDTAGTALLAGGEKLRNFTPFSPETRVYNMYGSTELATIFSIRVYGSETIMPIGYLTKDTNALLVDENLSPVRDGEPGELLVSDARMSHQYLHLKEQTAQKWIKLGGRLYFRTGDRMRRDADGIYYILGRMDNMVKLRGFRVETGEVEVQVSKAFSQLHFPVGQVVVVLKTINGIDHLACYYESADAYDDKQVTAAVSAFLPSYMIPDLWTAVKAMPRNANGKVIRGELPEPSLQIHLIGAIFSEAELRVVEGAGSVLNLEGAIDPDDSFVQLGGDSLRAMELASMLSDQGIRISGAKILALPSLHAIAAAAQIRYERLWTAEEYEAVKYAYLAHGEKVLRVLPLTSQQDDLICQQLIHPDRMVSDNRFWFVLESRLEERVLRRVLDTLSQRYSQLRASIAYQNVSILQGVITDRKIPLQMIHTDGMDVPSVYALLCRGEDSRDFDLQFTPMFRVTCVDRENESSCLMIAANKAAYELSMLRMLFAELMELLQEEYPKDQEIRTWRELFSEAADADAASAVPAAASDASYPDKPDTDSSDTEIFIYSDQPPRKVFFIHTGNTGSSAYYQLAQRIRQMYSFAVIEPYNLYHNDDIRCGIPAIAAKYIEIMKRYQPNGPYILGGWCYGGVVAHEMACQLEALGETVEHLILLDAHALASDEMRTLAAPMQAGVKRTYFETCPLFKDLRENGMLDAVVENAARVARDLNTHVPKNYHGTVTYFKPEHTPAAAEGDVLKYWQEMMKRQAGNYENYCDKDKLTVVLTPREHDEMMAPDSLDIIVPKLYEILGS